MKKINFIIIPFLLSFIFCINESSKNIKQRTKLKYKVIQKFGENIEKLKVKNRSKIFFDDVFNVIEKQDKKPFSLSRHLKFDLIFCDPPFEDTNINRLIKLIFRKNLLSKNGIIIIHRHKKTKDNLSNYFKIIDERLYGISKIIFVQLSAPLS